MKPISDINTPDMSAFWMPFTANQQFKAAPRILKSAEGMYYHSEDGRKILDGTAGLWCCNAGHGRREIAEAVSQQISHLDFAPTFQMGHPLPFELANRLVGHKINERSCYLYGNKLNSWEKLSRIDGAIAFF